jgi:hypothetical protein
MPVAGGCRCGAVRYTLAVDAVPAAYACHCHECQTWSGSAFSEQILIAEDGIATTGPVVRYDREGTGGRISQQRVCGVCHTRIFNTNTIRPGVAVVRAGTLDDSHLVDVVAHIWTRRKQPWLTLPDSVPNWPEGAPIDAMAAALASLIGCE